VSQSELSRTVWHPTTSAPDVALEAGSTNLKNVLGAIPGDLDEDVWKRTPGKCSQSYRSFARQAPSTRKMFLDLSDVGWLRRTRRRTRRMFLDL